ncbi:hypothetical protein AGMMS50233_08950 [Endomicrobiia bacterium]|nr:hypothetical protein AGMMS50233_08950 [Endomicrobiia bacterium]
MKKKKIISAIILFGLALSSCKGCPRKHNTLDRNAPALNLDLANLKKLIDKLPDPAIADALGKIVFYTASKFLEHGAKVINNIAPADSNAVPNRYGIAICCYDPHRDGAAYYASVNASLAINLTNHIVTEIAKNINHCSYADKTHTAARAAKANASAARADATKARTLADNTPVDATVVREVAKAAYGEYYIDDYGAYNVNDDTTTDYAARAEAAAYADVATEIAKKLGELEEFFNKWKK